MNKFNVEFDFVQISARSKISSKSGKASFETELKMADIFDDPELKKAISDNLKSNSKSKIGILSIQLKKIHQIDDHTNS